MGLGDENADMTAVANCFSAGPKPKWVKEEGDSDLDKMLGVFTLRLAGADREVAVRNLFEMASFRRRVGESFKPLLEIVMGAAKDGGGKGIMEALVPHLLGEGLEQFAMLPFWYAPELEKFRLRSTDEELIDAAMEVFERVFPLYQRLGKGLKRLLPAGVLEEILGSLKELGKS